VAFIVAALSIVFFVYQFCCGTIVYPRRPVFIYSVAPNKL
jgi:hypothetical protein